MDILAEHPRLLRKIEDFLKLRTPKTKVGDQVIGETTMTGDTLQGSPLSLGLFAVYMSRRGEEIDRNKPRRERRTAGTAVGFDLLKLIDDCNSVMKRGSKKMDKCLEKAGIKYKLKWDKSKAWRSGVTIFRSEPRGEETRKVQGSKGERSIQAGATADVAAAKGEENNNRVADPPDPDLRVPTPSHAV